MGVEARTKVVEVLALGIDPPVIADDGTSLREIVREMRDRRASCALLTREDRLAGGFHYVEAHLDPGKGGESLPHGQLSPEADSGEFVVDFVVSGVVQAVYHPETSVDRHVVRYGLSIDGGHRHTKGGGRE